MRRTACFLVVGLLVLGCGSERFVGERYRAERDLWRANWEYESLSIRPAEVSGQQWTDLAARYEAIADRYAPPGTQPPADSLPQQVATLAARALFNAAMLHAVVGDTVRTEAIYARMSRDFATIPAVGAEVALVRARMAERSGEPAQAARFYQAVVDRIPPEAHGSGVARLVLDLPLRIARLRARAQDGTDVETHYAPARRYYEAMVRDDPDAHLRVEAQTHLAEIAADLQRTGQALTALRDLERQLRTMQDPPRDPCSIRLAIAIVQRRGGTPLDSSRATLRSLLDDYPDCEHVPQALMALAENANQRDAVAEALAYLDRIPLEHGDNVDAASEALLARAKLLESRNRWPEALEAYRVLPVRYPVTRAAVRAPLEIAKHYENDAEARASALAQAERSYRDFVTQYPPGPLTSFAREKLIESLVLAERHEPAIDEMLDLSRALGQTPRAATLVIAAAKLAYEDLADTSRATAILDQAAQLYPQAEIGRWAAAEAARLRGTQAP